MSLTFRAHFDGNVIVPDEPVDLPVGEPLTLVVNPIPRGVDPMEGLTLEEKLARFNALSGRIKGVTISDEALRRENIYEERL